MTVLKTVLEWWTVRDIEWSEKLMLNLINVFHGTLKYTLQKRKKHCNLNVAKIQKIVLVFLSMSIEMFLKDFRKSNLIPCACYELFTFWLHLFHPCPNRIVSLWDCFTMMIVSVLNCCLIISLICSILVFTFSNLSYSHWLWAGRI